MGLLLYGFKRDEEVRGLGGEWEKFKRVSLLSLFYIEIRFPFVQRVVEADEWGCLCYRTSMDMTKDKKKKGSKFASKQEHDVMFEREFMPHINSLYNFAYRLCYDGDAANDLVQETYMKAYRFFESYQQGTNAKAWLFRILKNSFINDFRKKSKEPPKVDYAEVETYYNSDDVNKDITADLRVESTQDSLGDEITGALGSLDTDFRTIIILSDLEGFKYEEMAKILDIPIGTVRSRLHRARNILKEKLMGYALKLGFA